MGSFISSHDITIDTKDEKEIKQILNNARNYYHSITKITIINCTNTGEIENILSNTLWYLRNLEELHIENTQLFHPELLNLKFLLNLKKLLIKNCGIINIDNMDFYELPHLQDINLSMNLIQTIPEKLFKLKKLYNLNLSRNKINTLPHTIENISFMTFDISYNDLRYLPCWISHILIYMKKFIINSPYLLLEHFFRYEGNPYITYIPMHVQHIISQLKNKQKIPPPLQNTEEIQLILDVSNICLEYKNENNLTKRDAILYIETNSQFKQKVKQNLLSFIDNNKSYQFIIHSDELIKGFIFMFMKDKNMVDLYIDQINFWFSYASVYNDDIDLINVLNYIFLVKNAYTNIIYDKSFNHNHALQFIERLNKTNFFIQNEITVTPTLHNFPYDLIPIDLSIETI